MSWHRLPASFCVDRRCPTERMMWALQTDEIDQDCWAVRGSIVRLSPQERRSLHVTANVLRGRPDAPLPVWNGECGRVLRLSLRP